MTRLRFDAEFYPLESESEATALLIIDMQRDFLEPSSFGEMLGGFVPETPSYVQCRSAAPPVWVLQSFFLQCIRRNCPDKGSPGKTQGRKATGPRLNQTRPPSCRRCTAFLYGKVTRNPARAPPLRQPVEVVSS